jgi:hypothetical protein
MVAAPSAVAADGGGKAKAAKSQKAKARSAGQTRVTPGQVNRRLNTTRRQVATARQTLTRLGRNLAALQTRLQSAEGGVSLLLGAAPQLVSGLQTLAGVVQNRIGPGLLQIQDVLTNTVQPALIRLRDEVGPGLVRLGAAYQAVEYGVTRVRTGPGGAGPALPVTAISPDIPDDGNSATASMELPVSVGANPGQVPENTLLTMRAAIRSVESDGAATGPPAGYVGGLLTLKCGGGPGAGGTCDADPGAGTVLVPPGAVMCVVGPAPNQNISVPGVGPTPFPLVTIQQKASRTDQTVPGAGAANPVAGASAPASVIGPLGDDANDGCTTGEEGNTLILTAQTQFVDIPTDTQPGPTE